jgi:transcriptional regulator with GAF, ATPase, and Fis domain
VAQGKLLRALQQRVIERVGGTVIIEVDVRVVAATNIDLRDEVKAGRFRDDLFFRLNVFPINLPPLKARRDDIPLLMDAFLRRYRALHGRQVPGFTPRAVQALLQYDFPGNIRELQNLIERGVIIVDPGESIDVHHLFRSGELQPREAFGLNLSGKLAVHGTAAEDVSAPHRAAPDAPAPGAPGATGAAQDRSNAVCRKALIEARYNVADAARKLGLTRAQLAYRLKKAGIH